MVLASFAAPEYFGVGVEIAIWSLGSLHRLEDINCHRTRFSAVAIYILKSVQAPHQRGE